MKRVNGSLLTRFFQLSTAFVALPLLMGAKGGCSAGDVPVGTDDHLAGCSPHDCDDLGRNLESKLCSDGSGLGRTVCAHIPTAPVFRIFPRAPPSMPRHRRRAGPTRATDLRAPKRAKICPDGTGAGRSVCARRTPAALASWVFPACPVPASDAGTNACGPNACDGLARTEELKICPDGSVGRLVCAKNTSGACFGISPLARSRCRRRHQRVRGARVRRTREHRRRQGLP